MKTETKTFADNDLFESLDDIPNIKIEDVEKTVVSGTDWTTETIIGQILKGNINLNPDFQRREVWDIKKKSKFIESLILGFPVPQIVLAQSEDNRGKYLVIDGKQRLLTICQFFSRENNPYENFKLKGLEILKELNGHTFSSLQGKDEFRDKLDAFENSDMRAVQVKNWASEPVLYNIFLRLNSSSVQLSTQELRQALHPGPFMKFLDITSGDSPALRKVLKNKKPDFRMRDAEILLRHIAFVKFPHLYKGDLKKFLDTTCKRLNKTWEMEEEIISKIVSEFEDAYTFATANIPKESRFRKWDVEKEAFVPRLNRAIFEVVVSSLTNKAVRDKIPKGVSLSDEVKRLCINDTKFLQSITSTTKSLNNTQYRFSAWNKRISELTKTKISKKIG